MADLAVIVLNWNGGAVALESVGSFARQTIGPEIWMIDNASNDGSTEAIVAAHPAVHLIRNDRNVGYARGVNQGLAAAGCPDYVLLANNDVVLRDPRSLERVVADVEAHPEVHGVCGRYEYPDGRFQHFYNQLPTEFDLVVSWGVGRHVPGLMARAGRSRAYHLADRDFTQPMTIEQPAFSCVLMRGETQRQVGDIDERFPIFFNDIDYCWRWREHGYTWHYRPEWRIEHVHGHSTLRVPRLNAELLGSAVRFARKHFRGASRTRIRAALVAEAAWRKALHRDFPVPLSAVWRGDLFHTDARR